LVSRRLRVVLPVPDGAETMITAGDLGALGMVIDGILCLAFA